MTQFFFEQLLFYLAIGITLIAPGYLVLHFFVTKIRLSHLEKAALSVPVSFTVTTFTLLSASYANVPFNRLSVILILLITIALIALLGSHIQKKYSPKERDPGDSQNLSKKQYILIGCIFTVMCLTKGTYLTTTIFPSSTDLGHHMYWVQRIVTTGEVVTYSKNTVEADDPKSAASSPANFVGNQQIPDFIIGEHIIFAAIALISGISVVSSMPSLVLFLIHIVSISLLFLLSLRLFEKLPFGRNASVCVLFTIGALYAISGAQAKFVSGGVVGNILGNMLIISSLYFFVRALIEKSRYCILLGITLITALLYTHHLSMFIFGYVFLAWVVLFCVINIRTISTHIKLWAFLMHWSVFCLLGGIVAYIFLVHIPSYLDPQTISGSIGAPSKSTRVGLPLWQLIGSSGMMRFFFGICGLIIFAFTLAQFTLIKNYTRKLKLNVQNTSLNIHPYAYALVIAWVSVLLIMTLEPGALKVNILSTRIATYIIFPLAITSGFFLGWLIYFLNQKPSALPQTFSTLAISFFFLILTLDGLNDNSASLKEVPEIEQTVQTFHNALYLKEHAPVGSWSLKDHNHLESTAWMKVFMASESSDYSNPLSRALLARYESQPRRENCTREMISNPSSALATVCFENLNIGLVSVNTEQDAGQFIRNDNFIRVYQNSEISTFLRK